MNILDQIVLEKKNHLEYLSQKVNKKNNLKSTNSNSFLNAIESNLSKNKNVLIAEFESILEAEKIRDIDAKLIGINNRNLKKQKIDINKSIKLSKVLNNKIIISESGVTVSNIKKIKNNSEISSFLIGGSILNNEDKVKYINKLYKA